MRGSALRLPDAQVQQGASAGHDRPQGPDALVPLRGEDRRARYNGAGKSTILKVMAVIDQEFRGDANLTAGVSVGYLEQEPELDETKDVRGNVEDGLAEIRDRCP